MSDIFTWPVERDKIAAPFLDRVRKLACEASIGELGVERAILQAIREYSALPNPSGDQTYVGGIKVSKIASDCESAKLKHYLGE